jgi:hypothetical protein
MFNSLNRIFFLRLGGTLHLCIHVICSLHRIWNYLKSFHCKLSSYYQRESESAFFKIRIYSLCGGRDSLRQFQIGLYCTLVRLPSPHPTSGSCKKFHCSISYMKCIHHIPLCHSPSSLPQVPHIHCTNFTVLSVVINF